jgi:lysophospholipase L1-like esterase
MKRTFKIAITAIVLMILLNPGILNAKKNWVGTWATAPQLVEPHNNPPAPGLSNNSIREIVRVSIGGKYIRVKFSNEHSKSPVTLKSVNIAASTGNGNIDIASLRELKFNGQSEYIMQPGAVLVSDPVKFDLKPRMDVAITLYIGNTSETVTGHPGSRTTSYIIQGNDKNVTDFSNAVKTDHWYIISGIDVVSPKKARAVAIIGNSITDGRGSGTNLQNRWPDIFSERLLENKSTKNVGVLNLGIGGNCVLRGGLGPTALRRYDKDVLGQSGVKWVVIFEGVNDLGGIPDIEDVANKKADDLINAYKEMINKAHEKGLKVYGATIMPFKKNGYYKPYREMARNKVNEWIRTGGFFDAVIDFDKTIRNPADTACMIESLQDNDYLHPNQAGHRKTGESVDLNLFK